MKVRITPDLVRPCPAAGETVWFKPLFELPLLVQIGCSAGTSTLENNPLQIQVERQEIELGRRPVSEVGKDGTLVQKQLFPWLTRRRRGIGAAEKEVYGNSENNQN